MVSELLEGTQEYPSFANVIPFTINAAGSILFNYEVE
jgi:hypothetical protein